MHVIDELTHVEPGDLCGGKFRLEVGGRLMLAGVNERIRNVTVRDCLIECVNGHFGDAALSCMLLEGLTVENVYIRGGGIWLVNAWNTTLHNVTLMNSGQRNDDESMSATALTALECNDIIATACRFEASTHTPVYVTESQMVQFGKCKFHGTGPERPRQYEGPLIRMENVNAWSIDGLFAHGRALPGGGIVEVIGPKITSGKLDAVLQLNCSGELLVQRNVHPRSVIDVREVRSLEKETK